MSMNEAKLFGMIVESPTIIDYMDAVRSIETALDLAKRYGSEREISRLRYHRGELVGVVRRLSAPKSGGLPYRRNEP